MAFEDKLRKFLDHFEKLESLNGGEGADGGYYKEFMELKGLSQQYKDTDAFPAESGKLPCNKKKNRFKDILPFEHTRVVLHPEEDVEGSDYINANYITDSKGDVTYIASQGPLPHTVNDFWRMLWYHNIEVVVMACREYEMGKHKCEQYWPEKGEVKMFGPIKVTTISENSISNDFVVREVQAECQGETQKIQQYHYNAWPDHLKPTAVFPIIRMIEMIHKDRQRKEVPIVVHCSAGCGRTGTIIAIDILREIILNKDTSVELSVYEIVKTMRTQRPAMVQAKDQYHFVYQAASMVARNMLEGKKQIQRPPVSSKPGSKPAMTKSSEPPSTSSTTGVTSVPGQTPGTTPGGSDKPPPSSSAIYQNTTIGEPTDLPKPMPRKKSTRSMEKNVEESKPPVPPPKPTRSPDSSPKATRTGPPPEVPKKPSPVLPKKTEAPPKKTEAPPKKTEAPPKKTEAPPKKVESITPKKPSIMDLLIQECGDLLEEDTEPLPPKGSPPKIHRAIAESPVEEADAPVIPQRTQESLRLIESTYEVPGANYEVPDVPSTTKPSTPAPPPPTKPTSVPTTPIDADTPPELPPSRSQPFVTPPPGQHPPSSSNGSSSSSNPSKLLSKLLSGNKKEKKKPFTSADISGPTGATHTGGSSGGLSGGSLSVPSSRSRSQTPEPRNSPVSASEYAMPLMDRIGPSKFNFAGELGFGVRIPAPKGPRSEPLQWKARFRKVEY